MEENGVSPSDKFLDMLYTVDNSGKYVYQNRARIYMRGLLGNAKLLKTIDKKIAKKRSDLISALCKQKLHYSLNKYQGCSEQEVVFYRLVDVVHPVFSKLRPELVEIFGEDLVHCIQLRIENFEGQVP